MRWNWPSWRLLRRLGLGLIGFVLVLRILAFTPLAHNLVETRLEALTIRGQSLNVEGVSGDLLGRFSIDRVLISDASGTWSTVKDVSASWRVFPLLSGRLYLQEVRVDQVDAIRRPELAPAEPRESSGASFLKNYTLEQMHVAEIALASGIAGPAQTYQLDLSLKTQTASGDVELILAPRAGGGDAADVNLAWGADIPLRGQARIQGAANGIIAQILQVPAGETVSAEIDAAGDASAWDVTATSEIGDQTWLQITSKQDGTQITFDGDVSLKKIGAGRALAERLGDRITLAVAVSRTDGAVSAALEAGTLSVGLSGRLISEAGALLLEPFSAQIRGLDAARVSGVEDFELSELGAEGRLTISGLRSWVFDGALVSPQLGFGSYQLAEIENLGMVTMRGQSLELNTSLTAASVLGLPEPLMRGPQTPGEANVAATLDLSDLSARLDRFALQLGAVTISAKGQIGPRGPLDLSGEARLDDLENFGAVAGNWSLKGVGLDQFDSEFSGTSDLTDAADFVRDAIGERIGIDLTLARRADAIALQRASLTSDRMSLSAQGELKDEQISLNGQAAIAASARGGIEAGAMDLVFNLSGAMNAPAIALDISTPRLVAADQTLSDARLNVIADLTDELSGRASLHAELEAAVLASSVDFVRSDDRIDFSAGSANWQALQLAWAGQLDPSDLQGSNFQATVSGTAPQIGAIDGAATYEREVLRGRLSLSDAALGAVRLEQVELTADGQWPTFQGQVSYHGETPWLGREVDFIGDQSYAINASETQMSLDGTLSIAGQVMAIEAPAFLTLLPKPRVTATLKAFNGDLSVQLDPSGETRSSLTISDVALAELGSLINRPALLGSLNGDVEIQLENGLAIGAGAIDIRGLGRGDFADEPTDVSIAGIVEDNRLSLRVAAQDRAETLDLSLSVETRLMHRNSLPSLRLDSTAPRPVRLHGSGQIAPIWALLAPSDLRLEGVFDVDLSNGDGSTLSFAGPAALRDGVFEDGFTGLHLKELEVDAVLEPSGIQIDAAKARGARGGRVSASGSYGFDDSGEISVLLAGLDAFNRSDITAAVSGNLSVDRRNRLTHVKGEVEIERAKVDLSRLPKAGYTTLDVTFAEDAEGDLAAAPQREAINLDLSVTADRGIFVAGAGVDTEWAANVRVNGPAGAPDLTGRATLVRGEADLLGRRFRFAEGIVRFIGDVSDTELQVRADRTSGGITSSIGLNGNLSDPQIELSSDPQVPDDEILARVLFGRSPSELSPLQAAQLATAAARLAGGNAFNLAGQLEAATGLDRLDIGFNDEGAATLSTGKYLAEDVYLEVESGVSGAPGLALEWTPLENVAIDAEIDPELGPKIALQWTQDFDRLPFDDAPEQTPK
ncbi:MAG: translocation/assembly module TamB domain-containing protein [Pseudomonadota bacterium]